MTYHSTKTPPMPMKKSELLILAKCHCNRTNLFLCCSYVWIDRGLATPKITGAKAHKGITETWMHISIMPVNYYTISSFVETCSIHNSQWKPSVLSLKWSESDLLKNSNYISRFYICKTLQLKFNIPITKNALRMVHSVLPLT